MTTTIDAIYRNGNFVPLSPVDYADNQAVTLRVVPSEMTDEEFAKRVDECKSVDDLVEFCKHLPKSKDGDGIEMLKWIDETRKETGYRLPFEERP